MRPQIVVVDDDASVRKSLRRLLRSAGMRARVYESAEALLKSGDLPSKGCLILDVGLPGIDGFALLQRLVDRGSTLPAIFITARGDEETRARAREAGAALLQKPFEDCELLEAVSTALGMGPERPARPPT